MKSPERERAIPAAQTPAKLCGFVPKVAIPASVSARPLPSVPYDLKGQSLPVSSSVVHVLDVFNIQRL